MLIAQGNIVTPQRIQQPSGFQESVCLPAVPPEPLRTSRQVLWSVSHAQAPGRLGAQWRETWGLEGHAGPWAAGALGGRQPRGMTMGRGQLGWGPVVLGVAVRRNV